MRSVTSSGGMVSLVERDEPVGEGLILSVTSSSICGSDLHMVAAGLSGVVLGHEFGGFLPDGRLVAVRPTGECGTCASCRGGHTSTCRLALAELYGSTIDGGLCERVLVDPLRVVEMPTGADPMLVSLVEPLAVAVHGVGRSRVEPGMRTLVVGAGSIGLLTAAVLAARGHHVDIVARHPHQATAAEMVGARATDAPAADYDVSFDAVCTQQSLDMCTGATKPRGTIVEFGMAWTPVALSNTLLLKEISLVPTMFYGRDVHAAHPPAHPHGTDDFAEAAQLLVTHPRIASAVVTHRFPLDDAVAAFRVAGDRGAGAIKVQIDPR